MKKRQEPYPGFLDEIGHAFPRRERASDKNLLFHHLYHFQCDYTEWLFGYTNHRKNINGNLRRASRDGLTVKQLTAALREIRQWLVKGGHTKQIELFDKDSARFFKAQKKQPTDHGENRMGIRTAYE